MDYDRSRLNAEIAEMEARRAAEARARQDALEREQRGPVYRGALARIREGIRAGREEAREVRAARARVYREYDETHPSEIGKKLGRVVERAGPVAEPVSRLASKTATATKKALQKAAEAAREQQRRQREQQRRLREQQATQVRRGKSRKAQRAAAPPPPPPPARRPINPLAGLDDMLIQQGPKRPKTQKRKKKRGKRDDPFDLGGFRLM